MSQPEPNHIDYFLKELSRILGREMSPIDIIDISDEEISKLDDTRKDEFSALMIAAAVTPEIFLSEELNNTTEKD